MRWRVAELADVIDGRHVGSDAEANSLAIDSRQVRGGELFLAVKGKSEGSAWIPDALARGAVGYVTDQSWQGACAILVEDVTAAAAQIGRACRARLPAETTVIGITGSVGKTTIKDLAKSVLAQRFVTHASERSFNNQWGVPITLFASSTSVEMLIQEMGARQIGDLRHLCSIALPSVGLVSCVAPVHTETFGDLDSICAAKRELVEALPEDGTAILNADDERVAAMSSTVDANVLLYGDRSEIRAELIHLDPELRPTLRLTINGDSERCQLEARGAHQAMNAAAAAAIGVACGLGLLEIVQGLEVAQTSESRMALSVSSRGVSVLDDSYNANPLSMRAALTALASISAERRFALLGAMAELGSIEAEEHRKIRQLAVQLGIELIAIDTNLYGVPSMSPKKAWTAILANLGDGDAVLLKGSRVAGLETLAQRTRVAK